jgi:hypothetical protein
VNVIFNWQGAYPHSSTSTSGLSVGTRSNLRMVASICVVLFEFRVDLWHVLYLKQECALKDALIQAVFSYIYYSLSLMRLQFGYMELISSSKKGSVFWDISPCNHVKVNRLFIGTHWPWRWRWHVFLKRRLSFTGIHGIVNVTSVIILWPYQLNAKWNNHDDDEWGALVNIDFICENVIGHAVTST